MRRSALFAVILMLMASPCLSPTRFYYSSSGTTPEVLPTTANYLGWTNATALKTFKCTSKNTGTALIDYEFPAQAGNNKTIINCRYVSPPLIAQTISGSVEGQTKGYASQVNKVVYSAVGIYIINMYGTPEATLLPITAGTTTFATIEPTNRNTPAKIALTPWTCSDSARVVIEIGSKTGPAGAGTSSQEVGDPSPNDLPIDETTVGNYNPWIEFSNLIITKSKVTLIE